MEVIQCYPVLECAGDVGVFRIVSDMIFGNIEVKISEVIWEA